MVPGALAQDPALPVDHALVLAQSPVRNASLTSEPENVSHTTVVPVVLVRAHVPAPALAKPLVVRALVRVLVALVLVRVRVVRALVRVLVLLVVTVVLPTSETVRESLTTDRAPVKVRVRDLAKPLHVAVVDLARV